MSDGSKALMERPAAEPAAQRRPLIAEPAASDRRDINNSILAHELANKVAALQIKLEMTQRQLAGMQKDVAAFAPLILMVSFDVPPELRLPELLKLNDVIEGLVPSLRQTLDSEIYLEWRPSPVSIRKIKADKFSLRALFTNLALNSTASMKETANKKFSIETFEVNSHVIARVTDTGKGMDQEMQEAIIHGDPISSKSHRHLGEGMTHMRGIIAGLGGTMEIHSAIEIGTTFTIYFPVATE